MSYFMKFTASISYIVAELLPPVIALQQLEHHTVSSRMHTSSDSFWPSQSL